MHYSYAFMLLAASLSVNASPYPQGVTKKVAPSGRRPTHCVKNHHETFGIAVLPRVSMKAKRNTMIPASRIVHGHIMAPTAMTYTMTPATQIGDGQIRAPKSLPIPPVVTQINDGQVQAPSQPPVKVTVKSTTLITMVAITQIDDHQIQAPTTSGTFTSVMTSVMAMPRLSAAPMLYAARSPGAMACKTTGNVELVLKEGVLTDAEGRTGYIASNFQLQFDAPPQSGSIYTAGFSACPDFSMALGNSTEWWQCRSGDYYNLYDRNWAFQCEPVSLAMVTLVDC